MLPLLWQDIGHRAFSVSLTARAPHFAPTERNYGSQAEKWNTKVASNRICTKFLDEHSTLLPFGISSITT